MYGVQQNYCSLARDNTDVGYLEKLYAGPWQRWRLLPRITVSGPWWQWRWLTGITVSWPDTDDGYLELLYPGPWEQWRWLHNCILAHENADAGDLELCTVSWPVTKLTLANWNFWSLGCDDACYLDIKSITEAGYTERLYPSPCQPDNRTTVPNP
jgi:hypothetical protein